MSPENGREARESSLAHGWTVEGQSSTSTPLAEAPDVTIADDATEASSNQLSSGALVLMGLFGGLYLLYTVVWFSWANAKSYENALIADSSGAFGAVLQQLVFWIAPLAPALWFFSVLVLTREASFRAKVLWILAGVVVLMPLPMFGGLF